MTTVALFVRHTTQPGKRSEVQAVWLKHMAPGVAANEGHLAYFYCVDTREPDVVCAFQHYASAEAARAFLLTESYRAYLSEVEPLLAGPPEVISLTPVWVKPAQ